MKNTENARNRSIYIARINRVIDYIEEHLDEELTLERLSGVAYFSPYHFHRLFRYFVGEPLGGFIQRLRLERAATQLLSYPEKNITDIALDSGFSGSSAFARAFRDYFGISASAYRENAHNGKKSKIGITENNTGKHLSNPRQEFEISSCYLDPVTGHQTWRISMEEAKEIMVEVKELPEMEVAYVRHIGPYKGDATLFEGLYSRLFKWAMPRGIFKPGESKILSVYHDDPHITDEENLRLSACMTIPPGTNVDGEMGKMTIQGGNYAVGHFELNTDEFEDAWKALMGEWLPDSGYQCNDGLCYELCLNNPKEHPEGKHIVDICVPIRPL